MADGHHHVDVLSQRARDAGPINLSHEDARRMTYRAVCDCGWAGILMTNRSAAAQDGDEHVVQMARCDD